MTREEAIMQIGGQVFQKSPKGGGFSSRLVAVLSLTDFAVIIQGNERELNI